jgi:Flp pilus assembly pilin Flp
MIVWTRLWAAEEGQDVVEYTLLLAFIALVGAAAYLGISRSINILWTIANSQLATANAS